jgi:CheY-like chemotaxis protein
LLAEDFPDFMLRLRILLEAVEVDLACFLNGEDAIAHVRDRDNVLDLVITDLDMPRRNGWQVIEAVRRHRGAELPIIIQTGEASYPWVRTQARELGVVLIDKRDIDRRLVPAVRRALALDQ